MRLKTLPALITAAGLVAGGLVFGSMVALPAPAEAAFAPSISIAGGVLWPGCDLRPYTIDVGEVPAGGSYDADITTYDAAGYDVGGDDLNFDTNVVDSGSVQVCSHNGPGTWRLDLTVKYYDGTSNLLDTETASVAFTMRNPRTWTGTSASPRRPKYHHRVGIIAHVALEAPNGRIPCKYCPTKIERWTHSKWRVIASGTTNGYGNFRKVISWPVRHGKLRFRSYTPGAEDPYSASTSPTLTVSS